MKLAIFSLSLLLVGGFFIFFNPTDETPLTFSSHNRPIPSTTHKKSPLEKKLPLVSSTKVVKKVEKKPILQNPTLVSLKKLLNCETTQTCPQDNTDPRASDFLKSKQIIQKLQKLREAHRNNTLSSKELEKISLKLLNYPDSAVVEKSLELLAQLPPKPTFKKAVLTMFSSMYDAKLVTPILLELSRHPQNEQNIQVITNILQHGSFYVAQELASKISPFINPNNVTMYKEVVQTLPLHSKKRDYLEASILEFTVNR